MTLFAIISYALTGRRIINVSERNLQVISSILGHLFFHSYLSQ